LVRLAVLAWVVCRAVYAHKVSPVFSESAGRLVGSPAADEFVARMVRRRTPPDEAALGELPASTAVVADAFAWLADATTDELAELYGSTRIELIAAWPNAAPTGTEVTDTEPAAVASSSGGR
jgi:hypothetical protein